MDNEKNKCCGEHDEKNSQGCCGGHDHSNSQGCCGGHDHDEEGCGCAEHELENYVVDLEDDNGNVISCPIVDAFEYEGAEYVLAQNEEDDSVYLFKSDEEGELTVPDEAEFDKVAAYYSDVLANEE
ncbi:MAG: DUF1292 domain-containing protein [Clostridium sp.]